MTVDWITVRDGKLYWRGVYKDEAECAEILATFSRPLTPDDWFAPNARAIREALTAAMAKAQAYYEMLDA